MTRHTSVPEPLRSRRPDGNESRRLDDAVRDYWGSQAWTCQLCGGPIPTTAPIGDPMRWSKDHVIPLAAGGGNDLANLQPAHAICNLRKYAMTTKPPRPRPRLPHSRTW